MALPILPDSVRQLKSTTTTEPAASGERKPAPLSWWIGVGVGALALLGFYALLSFQRLEIFKMLLQSFFPLVVLILAVLGSIVFGLTTPTEAAAVGAFGGFLLAAVYATIAKRSDKAKVFAVWLLLWAPALAAIGWFMLHNGGSVAQPVPVAFGTLADATAARPPSSAAIRPSSTPWVGFMMRV